MQILSSVRREVLDRVGAFQASGDEGPENWSTLDDMLLELDDDESLIVGAGSPNITEAYVFNDTDDCDVPACGTLYAEMMAKQGSRAWIVNTLDIKKICGK